MKKKIAFIEPFRHYEVLAALLRLIDSNIFEVHCFCSAFCKAQVPEDKSIKFYTSTEDKLDDHFLNQHINLLNTCSDIFFTTVDIRSSFFLNKELKVSLIGLIHNSHNFFFYKNEKKVDLKKYYLNQVRGDFRNLEKILARLDRVVVPTFSIEEYIRQKTDKEWKQKLTSIEIAVPKKDPIIHERDKLIITIPGTINQDRRDYRSLLQLIPLLDKQINQQIEFNFLGKPFSKEEIRILQQVSEYDLQHIKLVISDDYVDIETFEKVHKETDFLFLPVQQIIRYKSFLEERGKTCVSGNINDITQFNLPAIIPAYYPLAPELESMVVRYKTVDDLLQKLVHWIHEKDFNRIKKESDHRAYLTRIREKFSTLFSN